MDNLVRKSFIQTFPIKSGDNYFLLKEMCKNDSGISFIKYSKHGNSTLKYGGAIVIFGKPSFSWEADSFVEKYEIGTTSVKTDFLLGRDIGEEYEPHKLYFYINSPQDDTITISVF